jgi:hypothetical protein
MVPLIIGRALFGGVIGKITKHVLGYAIPRIIAALGISFIAYQGVDMIGQQIRQYITVHTNFGQWSSLAHYVGVYAWINIVVSAYLGAIAVKQVLGAFESVRFKGRAD